MRSNGNKGWCLGTDDFDIASVCLHNGEEPAIGGSKGICNVFYYHCNLQCIYCQNHQISNNNAIINSISPEQAIGEIIKILDTGVGSLGFVSASHYIPQTISLIESIRERGRNPVVVINTNGYDKADSLMKLEDLADVYLPDFKYMDDKLAKEYSNVGDYAETATKALREMFRQKGTMLEYDDEGKALKGVIIRHLVLPGHTDNSKAVLRHLATEFGTGITLSLMSQYYPTDAVANHPKLGRTLTEEEYAEVVDEMHSLGFYRGWIQETESQVNYRPDFQRDLPFE